MPNRIPHSTQGEYWSDHDQGLHRKWEEPERDEHARMRDPMDYSAIGGPESERSYGRTRSDTGDYPFGPHQGAADRDQYGPVRRGGYLKHGGPGHGHPLVPMQSDRGRGPRDYQRADDRIYAEICEALTDDADVDATHVDVAVSGGDVTLTGYVRTRSEKRRTEDVAASISGARDIYNQLRVQSPEGTDVGVKE